MTAAREVEEETGFRAAIGRSLTTVSYKANAGPKTVQYFAARRIGGLFTPEQGGGPAASGCRSPTPSG